MFFLSCLVVFTSLFHIIVKLWSEVVHGLFSRVSKGSISFEAPSVASHLLSNIQGVLASNNIVVKSKILYWVVDWVSEWLGFSFELSATS
jgi:hypothetical protein